VDDDREDGLGRRVHEYYVRTPAASPDLRERIMRGLDRQDESARRAGSWTWWWRPGSLRLAPAAVLAAACLLLVAGAWLGSMALPGARRAASHDSGATVLPPGRHAELASTTGPPQTHEVAFMLAASGARRVSLVGEFNGWEPRATPLVRVGHDGPWVVTIALPPGRHLYGFVIDGSRWMADPGAPLAPDDGFGTPSSVVVVGQEGPL